jgi:galactose oxidase-like protein/glyoxal oxidase-like protein
VRTDRAQFSLAVCASVALVLNACQDNEQAPPTRPETPQHAAAEGVLRPIDLIYVCGNKFLATNATGTSVKVEYRVVGTNETGRLTLPVGPAEDPGYGETELETSEHGDVELYRDEQRVARRQNENSQCGPSASRFAASVTPLASAAAVGSWSAPFAWPIVAIHTSLLPNGRVLAWGKDGTPQIWNPSTGSFTAVPSADWLFCSGHSFLQDGRLLVSGGHISSFRGIRDNNLFTPSTQSWSSSTPMQRGRWYPTNTTLSHGEVLILGGSDQAGVRVAQPEVWTSGALRVLSTASRELPYYPRTFLAPNGRVFYAGEQRTTRYLNPAGTGSWSTVGDRRYGTRDYGAAVMYDIGKILYVGGGRTTNTAEIINLGEAAPVWRWTGSMVYPRRHLNATVLPTGEVLVTGGTTGTVFNDITKAVHVAELWSPATGTWRTLASNTVRRAYHSTAILLPDGRVLFAGSGAEKGDPDETNAELFSPPYLFKGARPTISSGPSSVSYGRTFSVTTAQASSITKVSLIRLGSVTHSFDMNQRFQQLPFVRGTGTLTVTAPDSRNQTPPGHYMFFIMNGKGVPSKARIVQVK